MGTIRSREAASRVKQAQTGLQLGFGACEVCAMAIDWAESMIMYPLSRPPDLALPLACMKEVLARPDLTAHAAPGRGEGELAALHLQLGRLETAWKSPRWARAYDRVWRCSRRQLGSEAEAGLWNDRHPLMQWYLAVTPPMARPAAPDQWDRACQPLQSDIAKVASRASARQIVLRAVRPRRLLNPLWRLSRQLGDPFRRWLALGRWLGEAVLASLCLNAKAFVGFAPRSLVAASHLRELEGLTVPALADRWTQSHEVSYVIAEEEWPRFLVDVCHRLYKALGAYLQCARRVLLAGGDRELVWPDAHIPPALALSSGVCAVIGQAEELELSVAQAVSIISLQGRYPEPVTANRIGDSGHGAKTLQRLPEPLRRVLGFPREEKRPSGYRLHWDVAALLPSIFGPGGNDRAGERGS